MSWVYMQYVLSLFNFECIWTLRERSSESVWDFNINFRLALTFGKCASRTLAQSKLSACFTATSRTSLVSFLLLRLRDLMSSLIVADVFCRLSYFGFWSLGTTACFQRYIVCLVCYFSTRSPSFCKLNLKRAPILTRKCYWIDIAVNPAQRAVTCAAETILERHRREA